MARENITAGASTLAAMSQNVANMGQIRQNMIAGTTQALNNVGNSFLQWQDDFNKRKYQKWLQGMEEAKFNEQKRLNDANIDIANRGMILNEQAQPHIDNLRIAQAANTRANTWKTNAETGWFVDTTTHAKKAGLLNDKNFIGATLGATTGNGSTATGTQPNATQGTNGTENGKTTPNASSSVGVANGYNNAQKMTDKDKAQLAASINSTLPKYN